MTEFFAGVIASTIGAIISIVLLMRWDKYKVHKQEQEREVKILFAIYDELLDNRRILKTNRENLYLELKALKEGKSLVSPLILLQSGFWDLLKINLPQKLIEVDVFLKLKTIAQFTNHINEYIRSREIYRILSPAFNKYIDRLKGYNESILKSIECVLKELDELDTLVQWNMGRTQNSQQDSL